MEHDQLLSEIRNNLPLGAKVQTVDLADPSFISTFHRYYEKFKDAYHIDQSKGKALEHLIGLQSIDFNSANRYCDVASAASPIQYVFPQLFPEVEFWKQDMIYETSVTKHILGGLAQRMSDIPDGYFDVITLHNSFEHFAWNADSEFIEELDRVLSPTGQCLIVPLYVARTHRIYFDPTEVSARLIASYDEEATLIPVRGFGQQHARFYSPHTASVRIYRHLGARLKVTLLDLRNGRCIAPTMYPEAAVLFHR